MGSMLFVGLGLSPPWSITLEGIEAVGSCERIYLDHYTSPAREDLTKLLADVIGKEVSPVSREFMEGNRILQEASTSSIAILSMGDPMTATTHTELRVRAEEMGIGTKVIHAPSILCALAGETGLHSYNFGKPVTITEPNEVPIATAYHTIYDNLLRGLHTAVLLEYDASKGYSVSPRRALHLLREAEQAYRMGVVVDSTLLVVAERLGAPEQRIAVGPLRHLEATDFGRPPQTIVVPGKMHFTELAALEALTKVKVGTDNSALVERLETRMVSTYLVKTRSTLKQVREMFKENPPQGLLALLENAECYASDAERLLGQGKFELSVLNVGYTAGLLDSLRFLEIAKIDR